MEMRVYLKICEACGCLWYRPELEKTAYCAPCHQRLKDFPTPESRKRRGRPRKITLPTVFAVAATNQFFWAPWEHGEHIVRPNTETGDASTRSVPATTSNWPFIPTVTSAVNGCVQ